MQGVLPVLQTIDLDGSGPTPEQQAVALLTIIVGLAAIAFIIARAQYSGLPDALQRVKADLRGGRAAADLTPVYLDREQAQDHATVRDVTLGVLDDERPDQASFRGAAAEVRSELAKTWVPVLTRLPESMRRLLGLAVATFLFGLVGVSTEWVLTVLSAEPRAAQPTNWPGLVVSESAAIAGNLAGAIGAVPGADLAVALALTLGLTVGKWLFTHWYVLVLVLVAGGVGLTKLESEVNDTAYSRWRGFPAPAVVARLSAAVAVGIWVLSLGAVGLGRWLISDAAGTQAGTAVAAVAILTLLGAASIRLVRRRHRLRVRARSWWTGVQAEPLFAGVRTVTLAGAVLAGLFLPAYVVLALVAAPTVGAALLAAHPVVQALVGSLLLTGLAAVALQARAAWGDIGAAVRQTAATRAVRVAVVAGGLPVAVVVLVYTLVAGLTKSIPLGIATGVVAGVLARGGALLLIRARYRAGQYSRSNRHAQRVVVEGAMLDTREGEQAYIRLNGSTELLHPDREAIAETAADLAAQLVTDGDAEPTVAEWHAQFAFDAGVIDIAETRTKLRERARKKLYTPLRKGANRVPEEAIEEALEELPEQYREEIVDDQRRRGYIRQDGDYVRLRKDPYAARRVSR